jgi:hypothetical protein
VIGLTTSKSAVRSSTSSYQSSSATTIAEPCPLSPTHTHTRAHNRDTISEGIEGKQADLFEEIGVDTDEAAGMTFQQVELLCGKSKPRQSAAGIKRPRA